MVNNNTLTIMKKLIFIVFISFLFTLDRGFAQVKGISYTFSPSVEYNFWDDQAGLEDGVLIGGKIGIGFGEFFEFRGSYFQDLDLMRNFENYGFDNFEGANLAESEVDLKRYGAEIKANFSKGRLLPYVTVGTGIQEIKWSDLEENKQIYLSAGLGITIGLSDRFILTLEGKNTRYRYSAARNLLSNNERQSLGVAGMNFPNEALNNWSALASLQFYLGGRKPGEMTDLDRAYFDSFTGGSGGFNLGLEGIIGKMNFDSDLPFRDANMAGGSAGFDLGPYIGIRGFYWQALEEDEFLSTDPLAIYGGEVRMQLNSGGGITPFIMVGGGKIDVRDNYVGKSVIVNSDTIGITLTDDDDTGFAMGGAGLLIPLTKNFKVFGSARALLTSASPIEDVTAPEEIQTSYFYSAGFKLRFGKKDKDPNQLMNERISGAVSAQQQRNDLKADSLKAVYQQRVLELEDKVLEAYAANDLQKAEMMKQQKKEAEMIVKEIDTRNDTSEINGTAASVATPSASNNTPSNTMFPGINIVPTNSIIQMSPAEFENLIEEILESTEPQLYNYMMGAPNNFGSQQYMPQVSPNSNMDARLERLERAILGNQMEPNSKSELLQSPMMKDSTMSPVVEEGNSTQKDMLKMLYKLEEKLDDNNAEIGKLNSRIERLESGNSNKKADKKKEKESSKEEEMEEDINDSKKKKRKGLFGKKKDQ